MDFHPAAKTLNLNFPPRCVWARRRANPASLCSLSSTPQTKDNGGSCTNPVAIDVVFKSGIDYAFAMGIPRLTSFVDNTFTGWQREEIKGNLIIDGFSLCYSLYSFDWSHGGQFPEYGDKAAVFFNSLYRSGITPIVVMDGIDYKEEKTQTLVKRRNDCFKLIHKHTANTQKRNIETVVDGILPTPAKLVFIMVMMDLRVKFIFADGEADECIHQLSNAYSCPVLSSDSDFLMYRLRSGYIPFNRFHWEASPVNAEVFYYRAFCEQFGFKDENLRLIIPAVAGNDFLPAIDSNRFMSHVAKKVAIEPKGLHRLVSLVKYIETYDSLEQFCEKVGSMTFLEESERQQLQTNCAEMQRVYDSDSVISLEKMSRKTELLAFNSEPIPDWVLKHFREGNLNSFAISTMVVGKTLPHIFVDNSTIPSCVLASLPIRQFIYGLTGLSLVTEYYRENLELSSRGVHAQDSINGRPLPSLSLIPTLSPAERENLLYLMLGCDEHIFHGLSPRWKLVIAVTLFWIRHVHPPHQLIYALILCFVVCSTCPQELYRMRSQFFIPIEFRRSPFWMQPLHAFAQWQSAYMDTVCLNQLLMMPLRSPSPARLYDGKLAMFFSHPDNGDHLVAMLPIDHTLYRTLTGILIPRQQQQQHAGSSRARAYPPPPASQPHPSQPHPPPPPPHSQDQRQQQKHKPSSNQPPRFQNMSATTRGQQGHGRRGGGGGGRGGGSGGKDKIGEPIRDQQRSRHSGNGFRGRERGRGRGTGGRENQGQIKNAPAPAKDTSVKKGHRGPARGASGKLTQAIAEVPKFTHENRYASLGDEEDSDDAGSNSASD